MLYCVHLEQFPFPSPIRASVEVVKELQSCGKFDASSLSITGFSAGGAVALALSHKLGPARVKSVTAFFPMIEFEERYTADGAEIQHSEAIKSSMTDTMTECYIVAGTDRKDPDLTLRYADPDLFPHRLLLFCANGDTFYRSCLRFVEHVRTVRSHDEAQLVPIVGQAHNFDKLCGLDDERVRVREQAYEQAISAIRYA